MPPPGGQTRDFGPVVKSFITTLNEYYMEKCRVIVCEILIFHVNPLGTLLDMRMSSIGILTEVMFLIDIGAYFA